MTDEIKQLISQLDIEPSRKQVLLDKLDKNGVTAELAEEVKTLLRENETAIRAEAPELMAELEQAHKEFNSEMDKIDQEADALQKQASKDLDAAQLEDSRAALK